MNLTLSGMAAVLYDGEPLTLTDDEMTRVERAYRFLSTFAEDKVIYGINTGFGPMAQWRVSDDRLTDLQYHIVRSHATGMGDPIDPVMVRAAMMARLGTFIQGHSGVHPDVVRMLRDMVNRHITPVVPRHGSVGASGDLVQLAHIALAMIGEGRVWYGGQQMAAAEALAAEGLTPLTLRLRDGLALTNGTAMMTGVATVNQREAEHLLDRALTAALWMNEVAGSYDDFMAEPLNAARRHHGQMDVARRLRQMAEGSRCLTQREHELYDTAHRETTTFERKVQAYYSLRCIPQIYGPVAETLENARRIIEEELQAANDNPIIDVDSANVYHGGNFHGDYISMEQDKVKMAMTRVAMTAERQLNYLLHDRLNGILPPFLCMATPGLDYALQAYQFTATSTTAECQTLAMPNYVHSIPNNQDNQDIVSMGTNTALLTTHVCRNVREVLTILYVALAQATDCLHLADRLAPATRWAYDMVRSIAPAITADRPPYGELSALAAKL